MKKDAKKVRELTISQIFAGGKSDNTKHVPYIRLRGKWLEQCGFEEGGKVVITVEDKRLVVVVEDGY